MEFEFGNFGNGLLPFGLPGAALAQLAAIVNPANKPIQIEMHLQAQIGR